MREEGLGDKEDRRETEGEEYWKEKNRTEEHKLGKVKGRWRGEQNIIIVI
jgi:hypothetical protein